MSKHLLHIAIAALGVTLTFPDWQPDFQVTIDGSCAWLYNYLFAEDTAQLARLVFPHGPLDFLQSPLPIGRNLEIALVVDTLLRLAFAWSGLYLASLLPGSPGWEKWRYGIYAVALAIWLHISRMDVLLTATVGHFLLIGLHTQKSPWFLPAALMGVIGFLVKTIIGLPALMAYGVATWMQLGKSRKWAELITWWIVPIGLLSTAWILLFHGWQGFTQLFVGTYYLTVGNSAAVCHYPSNNWWLLGGFWAVFLLWPLLFKESRVAWWVILLPVFAFWKYGMSREDIWHAHTTFRYFAWAVGILLLHLNKLRIGAVLMAATALICFQLNLRNAESWAPYQWRSWGLPHFYAWTVHFSEKKTAALAQIEKNIAPVVLPDSIRALIGEKSIDIFPWHYAYAAANKFNLLPRHVPQSYAAYHPWLDALDAAFYNSSEAPEFLLFHLKPTGEGGQLAGLDDRYLLNDAPETIIAILKRYQVIVRQPRYLLLKKTDEKYGFSRAINTFTDRSSYYTISGLSRLKAKVRKTWKGRWVGALYKDEPLLIDLHFDGFTRRVKVVPAQVEQGIWLCPWMDEPSATDEVYRAPLSFQFLPSQFWQVDTANLKIEKIWMDTTLGFLPAFNESKEPTFRDILFRQENIQLVQPNKFAGAFSQVFENSDPSAAPDIFEVSAEVESPANNNCLQLVVSVIDANGQTAHYATTEYCPMGIGEKGWPIALKTTLPNHIVAPYQVKAYLWNTGTKPVFLLKFQVQRRFNG